MALSNSLQNGEPSSQKVPIPSEQFHYSQKLYIKNVPTSCDNGILSFTQDTTLRLSEPHLIDSRLINAAQTRPVRDPQRIDTLASQPAPIPTALHLSERPYRSPRYVRISDLFLTNYIDFDRILSTATAVVVHRPSRHRQFPQIEYPYPKDR